MTDGFTLALDASTYRGTVALFRGDMVVASGVTEMRGRDEERLMPTVARVLEAMRIDPADLSRVVCGAGPGSFTSLRIAASIAKGLAAGRAIALHAVPSLALIVAADPARAPGRWLASLDAMRGERYASLVVMGEGGAVREVGPVELHAAGDLEARAASLGATVVEDAPPDAAAAMRVLAAEGVDAGPVSLDAWEPAYGRVAEAQARWEAAHGRPLPG